MVANFKKTLIQLPVLRPTLHFTQRMWKDRKALHAIAGDIVSTYQQTAFMRQVSIVPKQKTLLVFALDDGSIYGLKLFGLAATALRLQGWRVRVIFRNRGNILGKTYLRAFGLKEFIYLEDVKLSAEERRYCQRTAATLMEDQLDIQKIKSWNFEGSHIGPQVISTLSRLKFQGMPDFNDPDMREKLSEIVHNAFLHVLRADKFIQRHPADLAITNEANYAFFGPLVDMAIKQGINVIQMIQPWKDDALVLRRLTAHTRREHPSSVSKKTMDMLMQTRWDDKKEETLQQLFADRYGSKWFLQKRNQQSTQSYTLESLQETLLLDPYKKTVVVFSHVLWDANLFYGEDLFKDYGDWFVQTVKAACANDKLNWLIKLHPANVWKRAYENITAEYAEHALIRQEIGELPAHVKLIDADSNISTFSLFEIIDYGVTVRGTPGMELPCFGKPCLTAGTGRYSDLGFTIDSSSREAYLNRLSQLHTVPAMTTEEVTRAKWHAYAAFVLRLWPMRSANAEFVYQSTHSPLGHNLRLTTHSIEDIGKNGDLADFARWAESDAVDYLQSI